MINKKRNVNLQLTISKTANERFLKIQQQIAQELGFELTKSQIIEYLISKYEIKGLTETNRAREIFEIDRDEYQRKTRALKESLNISYKRLAQMSNIPIACLKNYGTGKQTPNEKNKIVIDNLLKKYNVKI